MDAFKTFLVFFLFVFKTFFTILLDDCILSLKKDFAKISPVFIRNNAYLEPGDDGAVVLKRSETIIVACPGHKRLVVLGNYTSSYNVLEAHCIINTTFRVERWTGQFQEIRCNSQPSFITKEIRECYNGAKLYKVGYDVKSKLYPLYEACFNSGLLTTHYVKHAITPSSRHMQVGSARLQFIEGDLFGDIRMSNIYKVENQRDRLDAVLGSNMSAKYITKKQFLTRGHLAARADFTFRAVTRATFHYINAAPQWQRGNAGDWAALEDALRRRVQSLGRTVTVHTGTHMAVTLEDREQKPHPVHLYADTNNNLQVPVPLYFYKLVYDPKHKKATAFISINSSYYNSSTIEELTFCNDVCEDNSRFSWLKWRSNDGTFSFCCTYEDFTDEVHYLDKINVTGLFY